MVTEISEREILNNLLRLLIAVIIISLFCSAIYSLSSFFSVDLVTGVVTQVFENEDGKFVEVLTDSGEVIVLTNKNAPFWGKTNSDEFQEKLILGATYHFKVVGIDKNIVWGEPASYFVSPPSYPLGVDH